MTITKFGHSCFLVEENGVRILFDPGNYSTLQNEATGIDLVVITHEHQDHFDPASLRTVLARNPDAKVVTNKGVAAKLDRGVRHELLEDCESLAIKGVPVEGFGKEHAIIYPTLPRLVNTGYFVANRLFYPGDAFHIPPKPVDILALPIAAPWMKIQEAIDYAKSINPNICFPVHDGILKYPDAYSAGRIDIFQSLGLKFSPLEIGKEIIF